MKVRIHRENLLLSLFLLILLFSICISSFYPIPAGPGEVGAAAGTLAIGDRSFYINDLTPFSSVKGYEAFRGGFLYPKILEGVSFMAIYIFQADTTSFAWNMLIISLNSFLALAIAKFIFEIGRLISNERVGLLAMTMYGICPYTYFYVLSGGITIFVLFGVSLVSYTLLRIIEAVQFFGYFSATCILNVICFSLGLIYLSCLRPSGIIFSVALIVPAFLYTIANRKKIDNYLYFTSLLALTFAAVVSIQQFLITLDYTKAALDAFVSESGMFFGYPRELLRSNINSLMSVDNMGSTLQGYIYNWLWKFMDFWSGINDVRDTHAAVNFDSLFSFFARLSTGFFYFVPLSLFASLSFLLNLRFVLKSGLVAPLFASLVAISPSLLGVAMSRYYFMFITPFIILAAILIDQLVVLYPKFREYFYR